MNETDDLYKIALLIDQLKHDDLQLRITASRNIVAIARALGAERTRDELIPFLTDTTDDEDEILVIVAEKLGELHDYVGGPEHYKILLAPLENLVCGEENAVRLIAIKSTEAIVERMNEADLTKFYFPMLNKLVNKDWFTARGSAAALAHLCHDKMNESMRLEVKTLFLKLCVDDTPFVRRAAAQNILSMIKINRGADSMNDYITAFKSFARDDQDSIRIQVVPIAIALLGQVSADTMANHIVPVILQIANDRSWRVRWSLANHLHEVLQFLEDSPSGTSLAGVFDGLLNDTEPEVRAASASHLSVVCKFLPRAAVTSKIMATAQRMVNDSSEFVRAFFAIEINHLSPLLGREATVQHILPMLLLLLRDDTSEVRLNVISSLDAINKIIGVELLSQSLLPAIVDLAQDHKWRVRLAIIEHIPMLGKQLGVDFFNEKLSSLCMGWLGDDVYSIRRAAAENLMRLTELFGHDWCREQIIPKIEKMQSSTSFSQRLTALYAVQVLIASLSLKIVEASILPLVAAMSADSVANIRFTVAKTIQVAVPVLRGKDTLVLAASVILLKLTSDSDRDVRFYSAKALAEFQAE